MEFKNFKSADDTEKRIALTSGHVYLIGREWIKIPEFAWSDCYAAGCHSEDMFTSKMIPEVVANTMGTVAQRKNTIRGILERWIEENDQSKFNKAGNPNTVQLQKEIPFKVTKAETMEVWYKLQEVE